MAQVQMKIKRTLKSYFLSTKEMVSLKVSFLSISQLSFLDDHQPFWERN